MKKLRLDLDHLQVESFDTQTAPAERGTVDAAQACTCPGYGTCANTECGTCNTCQGQYTCDPSQCNGSCGSCVWSCDYSQCDCPAPSNPYMLVCVSHPWQENS